MQVVDPLRANLGEWEMAPAALSVDPPPAVGVESTVTEWQTVGPGTGFAALAQSLMHFPPGARASRHTGLSQEALFVLSGDGRLHVDGASHTLEAESGAYLPPGEEYELQSTAAAPMRIVRVAIPDPGPAGGGATVRRLADQERQLATARREFRVVADPSTGLRSATHFVGYVPTDRAPDHFHTYDEVIHIIEGEGALHVGELHSPLRAGSSIQLPARTVHCLENTGRDVMRLVAMVRPGGSPADAYYPDGTPAYAGAPPITYHHQEEEES